MRFRYIGPVSSAVAAATLAVLPTGAGIIDSGPSVAIRTAISHPAGAMIPAVGSPLAYRYEGKASGTSASTIFACQKPGASLNCYTPQELATAYDIPGKLTGAGQTIVIIDAFGDPTIAQDLNAEDSTFGLPSANLNIIYPDGKPTFDPANANQVAWSGEIALDIESAHAIAPAATIDLVIAKSDQDPHILSALKYVVAHHLGSVLSQSYGEAESCQASSIVAADHLLFAAAAAEGVSVFASSGDNGAAQANCAGTTDIKSVGLPAADPLVTGVGATSLTAAQPSGTYESETAWNDQFGSSGGGYSTLFPAPDYQTELMRGAGHARTSRRPDEWPGRGVPDVSYSGDVNNGLLIAWSQGNPTLVGSIYLVGGTSAGSPQWAAIVALADQSAHHPLGFLNGKLYAIAHGPLYSQAFHDITTGNNTVTVSGTSNLPVVITGYPATKGWDPVTGLGTPDVSHLIEVLTMASGGR